MRKTQRTINEGPICRCWGQTSYGHDGPIMCNTSQGVQAWWAEDCCNKTMIVPEGCWVTSSTGGPGNGGPTKYDEKMSGTELANCRCPGNVLPGEYCDLNEICRAEAGGCFCREQDKAIEDKPDVETMNESVLRRLIKRVITERKKRKPKKKIEDDKYTTWCKEHGWEHGVGDGCVDDALDSEDIQMRSWAIGFMMGDKQC